MEAVTALEQLGGLACHADLLALTTRRKLRTALGKGEVHRVGRDRYLLPVADQARRSVRLCDGVLTHLSAALHWGWEVRVPPTRPQIGIPRGRPLPTVTAADVQRLRHGTALDGWATDPLSTVIDCARDLPFADALAVADSALRHGDVTRDELIAGAPQEARVRRVLEYADGRAANPFESSLRALCIEAGLEMVPQHEVRARGLVLHPDLVDPIAGVIVEAESWEWHGKERRAFESDCERYTALAVTGWRVLRFTWADVMHHPDRVRACLHDLYAELAS